MIIYYCHIRSESFHIGWQEETISLWPGTKAENERCIAMGHKQMQTAFTSSNNAFSTYEVFLAAHVV